GGEIGTVTSYVAESGGEKRRGLATSLLMTIAVSGLLLGSIVANGLAAILGETAMQDYGWRIPFLIAGPLGLMAAYIRSRLEDSAQFEAISSLASIQLILAINSSMRYLLRSFIDEHPC